MAKARVYKMVNGKRVLARTIDWNKSKAKPSVARVARAVKKLSYQVQGETKSVDLGGQNLSVAQLTTVGSSPSDQGYFAEDITPKPNQGTSGSERIGNTIKLKSIQFRLQGEQMKALSCKMKMKLYIVRVLGSPLDFSPVGIQQSVGKFLLPNPVTGYTEYHSLRNPEYYRNFKVLVKRDIVIQPDQIRLDATGAYAAQITDCDIFRKIGGTVSWDSFNTGDLSKGQIFMLLVANTGNSGGTAVTGSGIYNGQPTSGADITYAIRWNYTDK